MKQYILADNQDITREGLIALLKELNLPFSIGIIKDIKGLQDALKISSDVIVILDYTLFNFVSIQQMLNLKQGAGKSVWILFSEDLGAQFLRQVLLTDDRISIVMKQDPREDILIALENAYYDEVFLCEYAQRALNGGVPSTPILDKLTVTEKEILHEIALGKMTKQIALERNLSFHTVNAHRKNIFRKIEVNNVHEAIKYALRAGIIDQAEYYI